MPAPEIIRPTISAEKENALERYLLEMWRRAREGRENQIGTRYQNWSDNYEAIPSRGVRSVPWYNSANFVVPVIRMLVDTWVGNALNVCWATRPILKAVGFPEDNRAALEEYLHRKAHYDWMHYPASKALLTRGAKYGTAVVKTTWVDETEQTIPTAFTNTETGEADWSTEAVQIYDGPRPKEIDFDDFFVYPIGAVRDEDVIIRFHRLRYPEETARRKMLDPRIQWDLTMDELNGALRPQESQKAESEQMEMDAQDDLYRELEVVECYLKWDIGPDETDYRVVATICPLANRLIDLYFDPTPPHAEMFIDYRPVLKEKLYYGDPLSRLLEQSQEEASAIHNERRNNATLANAPIFKKKANVRSPNPSQNWYPGKVYEVDELDDFAVEMVGRNYTTDIVEEQNVLNLAHQMVGLAPPMQGAATGRTNRTGKVYNTSGTLAVMAEGNQRWNTAVRDYRFSHSRLGKTSMILQASFGGGVDPILETFPPEQQERIMKALEQATPERLARINFEVRTSDAATNKEAERSNAMTLANVLGQYGQQAVQAATALANPGLNPLIRRALLETVVMQRDMARDLLRLFDKMEVENRLVDVERILREMEQASQGAPGANPGGMGAAGPNGQRATLERVANPSLPGL